MVELLVEELALDDDGVEALDEEIWTRGLGVPGRRSWRSASSPAMSRRSTDVQLRVMSLGLRLPYSR